MNNLRKYRLKVSMTQAEIAKTLEIQTNRYGSWERGEKQPPTSMIPQLAEIFRVSADKLLPYPATTESDDIKGLDVKEMFVEFHPNQISYTSYELIIKLSIFEKPLHFQPPLDSLNRFIRNYSDDDYAWLMLETLSNTTHIFNKQHIEWFVIHDEAHSDWPVLARDGFHETPLMKNGISAATTIMAMAINASLSDYSEIIDSECLEIKNLMDTDSFSYPLDSDFEWLVQHKCALFDQENIELKESRKQIDYEAALADKDACGWFNDFKEGWGVRSHFADGNSLFKPSCTDNENKEWHEDIYNIFSPADIGNLSEAPSYSAKDHDGNKYTFRPVHFVMAEFPTAFLEMATSKSCWEITEHEPETLSMEDTDKAVVEIIETVHKCKIE